MYHSAPTSQLTILGINLAVYPFQSMTDKTWLSITNNNHNFRSGVNDLSCVKTVEIGQFNNELIRMVFIWNRSDDYSLVSIQSDNCFSMDSRVFPIKNEHNILQLDLFSTLQLIGLTSHKLPGTNSTCWPYSFDPRLAGKIIKVD